MLIICKGCKKFVDTDKHDFCPKCGSNFNYGENLKADNHTADYEEYERNRNAERRAAAENKSNNRRLNTEAETKRRLRNASNKRDEKKNGAIGCFVAVVFVIIMFGKLIGSAGESFESFFSSFDEDLGEVGRVIDDYIEQEVSDWESDTEIVCITVGYGETAYRENINVTCDGAFYTPEEVVDRLPDGYTCVTFHLLIEKLSGTGNVFYFNNAVKLYTGLEECEQVISYELMNASAEVIDEPGYYDGYVSFIVPADAEEFSLIWYNNTEIVIKREDFEGDFGEYTDESDDYSEDYEEDTSENEADAVGLGGFSYIGDCMFACTDMKRTEIELIPPSEGYMYVSFALSLVNTSDSICYVSPTVECLADGEETTMIYFSDDPLFMPFTLEGYEMYEGWACFEVPEDTEVFGIYYDDAVIEIENTLY